MKHKTTINSIPSFTLKDAQGVFNRNDMKIN